MGFYRFGKPGEDHVAHLNFGGRRSPQQCAMPRFEKDNGELGARCGRASVALCDAPGCDKPICELHRTRHASKANTDYCPEHAGFAAAGSGG